MLNSWIFTTIGTNLTVWLANLPLLIKVQTMLLASFCWMQCLFQLMLWKKHSFDFDIVEKNKSNCGLTWSVLLSIACVAGGIVSRHVRNKRASGEATKNTLHILLTASPFLAVPLPKLYFAHTYTIPPDTQAILSTTICVIAASPQQILTTVMTRIIVNKSTAHAKPHLIC